MKLRYAFLLSVFIAEIWVMSFRFDTPNEANGLMSVLAQADVLAKVSIVSLATTALAWKPFLAPLVRSTQVANRTYRWSLWFLCHLATFGLLFSLTQKVFVDVYRSNTIIILWCFVAAMTLMTCLFCFLPPRDWLPLIRYRYGVLLLSMAGGIATWLVGNVFQQFWRPFAQATLWITYALLNTAGMTNLNIVYDSSEGIIGTDTFLIQIAPACSGYEGIGLVVFFTSMYLFLFRHTLKFPQSLWLYPIGIAAVYIANSFRLATLILIGHFSSAESAVGAFHSQAGWTMFTLVSLGLLAISRKFSYWNTAVGGAAEAAGVDARPTFALLAPLLIYLAAEMLTSTFVGGMNWAYPLVVITSACALWLNRKTYRRWSWDCSWQAVAIGIAVFALWITFVRDDTEQDAQRAAALIAAPGWLTLGWVFFRALGSATLLLIYLLTTTVSSLVGGAFGVGSAMQTAGQGAQAAGAAATGAAQTPGLLGPFQQDLQQLIGRARQQAQQTGQQIQQITSDENVRSVVQKAVTAGPDVRGRSPGAADKVEGTVYNMAGDKVGTIRNVMIDKLSGKVVYATMAFGGMIGVGQKYHAQPWNVLTYNTDLGGYQLDIDREQLEAGPAATEEELTQKLGDKDWGRKVYDYYGSSWTS